MGQGDLTRVGPVAASHQPGVRDGVVRGAGGRQADQRDLGREPVGWVRRGALAPEEPEELVEFLAARFERALEARGAQNERAIVSIVRSKVPLNPTYRLCEKDQTTNHPHCHH